MLRQSNLLCCKNRESSVSTRLMASRSLGILKRTRGIMSPVPVHARRAAVPDGSKEISQSQVLSGLAMPVLEKALRRTCQIDQTQVGKWLLNQFQQ